MTAPIRSLEAEFRRAGNSWLSYSGGLTVTAILFVIIGSTRSGLIQLKPESEADLLFHFLPPPEAETQKPIPLASQPEANFKFDFPDPVDAREEMPLDRLDVALNLAPMADADIFLSLESRFKPAKPNLVERFIIYNDDQVDEKPVRIYAMNVSPSHSLKKAGASLYVLYRVTDKGRTENIHILNADNEEATELARRIIASSRFRPAKKDGRAVNVWVQHEMRFSAEPWASPFSL
jgi:hypothetical protein